MGMIIIIVIALILVIILPIIYVANNNIKYNESLEENNALAIENNAIHISGLPATGREKCSVIVRKEEIVINNGRQDFLMPMSKITGSVVNQETANIQDTQYNTKKSPSLGKAVVGGALFGPAGAIIGGASGKAKTTSNTQIRTEVVKLYLTINYVSDNTPKQIMFEGTPLCRFYNIQNNINANISNNGTYTLWFFNKTNI